MDDGSAANNAGGLGLQFEEGAPEVEVAAWITKQLNKETKRISSMGQAVLPVTARNCGIVREEEEDKEGKKTTTIMNRIELNSGFDFRRVVQVMTSPPVACPCKEGYSLVFVVMVVPAPSSGGGSKGKVRMAPPPPLLAPYIFDSRIPENDLSSWSLVNNEGAQALIKVEGAEVVTDQS